jgi:hypothetical protein
MALERDQRPESNFSVANWILASLTNEERNLIRGRS